MVAGLTFAPLIVKVDPNLNVVLTACLAVYVGCYRSVKPIPPSVSGTSQCVSSRFIVILYEFYLDPYIAYLNLSGDHVQ